MKNLANISATILMIVLFSSSITAQNIVDLTWVTKSETNNDFFTIQRSLDGINWITIATLNAAGTSTTEHTYLYSDETAPEGIVYYSLKQTDYNGDSKTMKVISVDNKVENPLINVVIYPNPTSSYITVESNGKIISANIISLNKTIVKNLGANITMVDVQDLPSGVYYINYTTENGSSNTTPFVKR